MNARRLVYPAHLAPDAAGGFVVTFRDVPEAITQGETLDEARAAASDALTTALEFYTEAGRQPPPPSEARAGELLIAGRPAST